MSLVVREIQPRDLAPILDLTHIIPEAPSWSLEDFRRLASHTIPVTESLLLRKAWVAESNAQVLGIVVVQSLSTPDDPVQPPECELESILVHPVARRSGIGQRLLSQAIASCMQQQAAVLRLEVRSSNQAAIRLYQKNGFTQTGTRPRYYSAPEEDALLMQKMVAAFLP